MILCDYCQKSAINKNYIIMDNYYNIMSFCSTKCCKKWTKKNWNTYDG